MLNSIVYNLVFTPAFIVYLPWFVKRLVQRGVGTEGFGERFGLFSKEKKGRLAALKDPTWVHAVSVGEVVAALNFMRRWQERDSSVCFVLSVTTTTAHAMAKEKLPPYGTLIYSPLDFLWSVQSALRVIQPTMLVIFEVEIWPNLIRQTRKFGARLALVNSRMSDKSSRGYSKMRWFFKPLFDSFDVICAQSEKDVQRVENIIGSGKNVILCNTMKFDQPLPLATGSEDKTAFVHEVFGDYFQIISAASTHPGEEKMILEVFQHLQTQFNGLKLILTPRHTERSGEVEKIISQYSLSYSLLKTDSPGTGVDVLLVNTTGELIHFLAVSDIVYVGKSMCGNSGGHNIIEPAVFGKVIVHGSQMQNFKQVVEIFQQENASLMVENKKELQDILKRLLADESLRKSYAQRSEQVVTKYRGAIDKTIDALLQL
ncbi:MAG: 3-deoxy-D-manno-octulosonic acid transferase [Thermodesulfobacteriota bacterium]|nr:3-deoxy-D-manno-octulosonic acid transferase [Thermodesulfobacteriota bacterium]